MSINRVLIAHQATIPHYRVPFYEAVERLRPDWWEFSVIYDVGKARDRSFMEIDHASLGFPIRHSQAYTLKLFGKQISFQPFVFKGSKYDLLVMGGELNNVSYPLCYFWRCHGKRIAYWGHGKDVSVANARGLKALAEQIKIWLAGRADGFFAYTNGVRDYMVSKGVDHNKIYVLNNTIDIIKQRGVFEKLISQREELRAHAGLRGKKVLLFVGRLNRQKRLKLLFDAIRVLRSMDESYYLLIIGAGDVSVISELRKTCGESAFRYLGVVSDDDIGQFYVASDLFAFPGSAGLGPIQALCFDLTTAVIDSSVHSPEYEYLNHENALIFPERSTADEYARGIKALLDDRGRWGELRAQAWPSIRHLTIENMAHNFINGVNAIFKT
jgi:glycosyltransferase involved in cell wall biosynthesis